MKDFSQTPGAQVSGEDQPRDRQVAMSDLIGQNFTVWSCEVKATKFGERAQMWVSPHTKEFLTGYDKEGNAQYERAICWGTHRIIVQLAAMTAEDYPFVATMETYRDSSYQLAAALPKGETIDDIIPF